MEEEELIITSYPYEGTDIIHNEPSLPSISTLINQSNVPPIPSPPVVDYKQFEHPVMSTQIVAVQEDIPPTQEEDTDESFFSPDVIMRWISDDNNKIWTIHTIADIVLFYMFLRFIQHQFGETETMIYNTRNNLNELKKQYGLE
jgi:hypothetical protein